MTKTLMLSAAVFVTAIGSGSAAIASCLPTTGAQQRSRAQLIFDGTALDGPTATGVQRFRVIRYLKGTGPKVVRVSTGNVRRADGTGAVTSVSIVAKRGENWRIFARGKPTKVLVTTVCDGSRRE